MKPTITLCKVDETEFINVRTYWALSLVHADIATIELQVRHRHPEDEFKVLSHDASERDPYTLLTSDEMEVAIDQLMDHEEISSRRYAREELEARNFRVIQYEQDVVDELRRTWDAFVLLFNPMINTF